MIKDDVSEELKKDDYQLIFDALASVSSYGKNIINEAGFISTTVEILFPQKSRGKSIEKVRSALERFYELELVEKIDNRRLKANEDSMRKYAKNVEKLKVF